MVQPRLGTDSGRMPLSAPAVPFSPSLNPTLAWYDVANAPSVNHTSNAVNTLSDLSGNARHVSNTSTARPTYDAANGKIAFNGTSHGLYNSSPFLFARNEKAVYMVVNLTAGANKRVVGECAASGSARYYPVQTGNSGGQQSDNCPAIITDANNNVLLNRTMNAAITGGKKIVRVHEKDGLYLAWVNGAVGTLSRSYHKPDATLTVTRFSVGFAAASTPSHWSAMDLYEMIITADDSMGEQIEGYLAHKHGLTADLPAGHRYKTSPPVQGDVTNYAVQPISGAIKTAHFGDSQTAQNNDNNTVRRSFTNSGNFHWYNHLAHGRCYPEVLPANHWQGVSGDALSQMITRMTTAFTGLDFNVCFFHGGGNSLGSVTINDMRLQLDQIISYISLTLGKIVVCLTITPRETDPTALAKMAQANEHIMLRHGSCMGRVISVDVTTVMDEGDGTPVPNALVDGVHYAPYGAYLIGTALDAGLEPYFGRAALPNFASGNLLTNGTLSGTGGTGTGAIATGWTLNDSGPADPVGSKDGSGHQTIATNYTASSTTNNWEFTQTVTGGYANGDKLYAMALVQLDNVANVERLQLEMRFAPDGVQTVYQAIGNSAQSGILPENFTDTGEYLIITPVIPLTTGSVTGVTVRLYHENDQTAVLTTSDVTIKGIGLFKK